MKTTRLLALPLVIAASALTLTGCFQLPAPGNAPVQTQDQTDGDNGGTDEGTTDEGTTDEGTTDDGSDDAAADLGGTEWSGDFNGQVNDLEFTLNEDGTVDFASWAGDSFDSPGDVWSGDASNLELTVTQITSEGGGSIDVMFTGTAENGEMQLQGEGTDGNSYTLTASEN